MSELAFPAIESPATPLATPPQKLLTVAEFVKAQFASHEPVLTMLATKHRAEAVDVSTPKAFAAAKAVRHELRDLGRYAVQNALKTLKADLNGAKGIAEAEAERLIGLIAPVEKVYDDAITAEEQRREAERQAELERQRIRKEGFDKAIRAILEYVNHAAGLPAERIARGVAKLETMEFDPEHWAEFLADAKAARDETLAKLRAMHAQAVERERLVAENEALRAAALANAANVLQKLPEAAAAGAIEPAQAERLTSLVGKMAADMVIEGAQATAAAAPLKDLPSGEKVDTSTGEVLPQAAPASAPPATMPAPPAPPAPPEASPGPAAMKLGDICAALGFTMTKAFVRDTLKVPTEDGPKGSLLVEGHRLPQLKAALLAHIEAWTFA